MSMDCCSPAGLYWSTELLWPHRLVFSSCTKQNRAYCFCRKSWIKQKCDRYGPLLRNFKKKPMFSTFCLLFPGHLWIRFSLPWIFKNICLFAKHIHIKGTQALSLFSEQEKKLYPLEGQAAHAPKLTNGQTSSQVPRRHVHSAYSTRAGERGKRAGSVPRVQNQPLFRALSGHLLAGQARVGWGSLSRSVFLLPAPVKAAYLELQTKRNGVIYFIVLQEDGIFPQSIFPSDLFCLCLQDISNILHSFHKKANRHQYPGLFFFLKTSQMSFFFPQIYLATIS